MQELLEFYSFPFNRPFWYRCFQILKLDIILKIPNSSLCVWKNYSRLRTLKFFIFTSLNLTKINFKKHSTYDSNIIVYWRFKVNQIRTASVWLWELKQFLKIWIWKWELPNKFLLTSFNSQNTTVMKTHPLLLFKF